MAKLNCRCSKEKEIADIHYKVKEMHKVLMGNSRKGLIQKWDEFQGALGVWRFVAGGGGLLAIITLILSIAKVI